MLRTLLVFGVLAAGAATVTEPGDLASALEELKQAESTGDAAKVQEVAAKACAMARAVAQTPAPDTEAARDVWTKTIQYAQQVEQYSEYALFNTALKGPAATTVQLLSTLEVQNPKSKYLDSAYGTYFLALNQTGSGARVISIAEKALANFPQNEDLLLVLSDNALNRKQTDRALGYSERLISALNRHDTPEGMSAAEWQRKKSAALGRAHWTAGMIHSEKGQYYEADRDLRAALPLVKGNDTMTAATLFYLGVANYQLGSMTRNRPQVLEAARLSEQAAAIKGPLSQQAWRNAQAMKAEAAKLR
jgi:tetratricopeptide (TPR) repeat protein